MWRYRLLALIQLIALILLSIGLIIGLGFVVKSVINFTGSNSSSGSVFRILFYLIFILGLTGVCRGALDFLRLGTEFDRDNTLFELNYEKKVRQTADYLILLGGALLFLWLL